MKNFLLIIILFAVTIWAFNLLNYKEPFAFNIVNNIDVSENKTEIELITSENTQNYRWFYEYEIKDNIMYITTYKVLNPLSKSMGAQFKININKGYKDFGQIYLNEENGNKSIWIKS